MVKLNPAGYVYNSEFRSAKNAENRVKELKHKKKEAIIVPRKVGHACGTTEYLVFEKIDDGW